MDSNKNNYIVDIETMAAQLVTGKPLLGLDPGTKTIGVAVCDSLHNIATPLETIRRRKFADDAAILQAIINDYGCNGMIIGLPLNMDGSEGPRAQSVRALARNLGQKLVTPQTTELSICFWDERLSSIAVERTLLEADASRQKRAQVIDKMAAGYILQGALDRMNNIRKTAP